MSHDGHALAEQFRRGQLAVRARTIRDLLRLTAGWTPHDIDGSFQPVLAALLLLIRRDAATSAGLASAYYRQAAKLEADEPSAFLPRTQLPDEAAVASSMTITGPVAFKIARRTGKSVDQAMDVARTKVAGSAVRQVLGAGRQTLVEAIREDNRAVGWERITDASPCAFCAMLGSRGAVYTAEHTADFQAHDACGCTIRPRFVIDDFISPRNREFRDLWNANAGGTGKEPLRNFRAALEGRTRDPRQPSRQA